MRSNYQLGRAGLTLLELVVVLVIIAALAALVVPRLNGVAAQANSATNASVVDEVNRAVALYETRFGSYTSGWDSLLNSSDAFFTKLNPAIQQTATPSNVMRPAVQITTLDAGQAQSLRSAGIFGFHDADESRVSTPSDNSSVWRNIGTGTEVATLVKTPITSGHGSTFIDNAFSIDQFKSNWNHEFVVVGLGGPTGLKGATLTEVPLVQSANPTQYYARVLCVFMIPAPGATNVFPAQYVGCFLPDGTSLRQNVDSFNSANVRAN
jgi:prepilin-type N-terminal cleavage/methylation domain-containing protein